MKPYDLLILGTGIAGLSTALAAAPARVAVLTPGELGEDGASRWAQGGIAAAFAGDDSAALHARDTLAAGQYLNDAEAVQRLTEAAPNAVNWLAQLGVAFDRDRRGGFALGREAAHSRARIVHAQGDASGAVVMHTLRVAAAKAAHLVPFAQHRATQLIRHRGRVVGVRAHGPRGEVELLAHHVVLATGGLGALYRYTTNPPGADGSGLALAQAAGATLADLEFVQFHPTALAPEGGAGGQLPLLTEALRGAGAVLLNEAGKRFMLSLSPQAELAPRDVVARAVWAELARGPVWLDATAAVGAAFPQRFPTVFATCMARGIDPRTAPIPVVPAQHYHMGGVRVDAQGRSDVAGLYAVGEVACSGVHGANRLASNSLLEGLVFGRALGQALAAAPVPRGVAEDDPTQAARSAHDAADAPHRDADPRNAERSSAAPAEDVRAALADAMWQGAGLVRDGAGLDALQAQLGAWLDAGALPRERLRVARALVAAAQARRDSVGAHFRRDADAGRRAG